MTAGKPSLLEHRLAEIIRQRRFEIHPPICARMAEAELPRVQHLPRKIFRELRAVNLVAENGMTEMMQVHANLMRAAAVQSALDQTGLFAGSNDAILRFGRTSTG